MGLFDIFKEVPELKVSMFGPRAVGKTTVMTSIFSESQKNIAGTNIYLQDPDNNLISFKNALVDAVSLGDASRLPASRSIEEVRFHVGLKNSASTLDIVIKDYPGEYLENATEAEIVKQFLKESDMILLAIDTPFMMEEGGRYNDQMNKIAVASRFFTENAGLLRDKLVLFVPLKCERYLHEGVISKVSKMVENNYAAMIDIFRKNNIASAVTPIMTLGGIEFDHFEDNVHLTNGKMAVYRSYSTDPTYRPLYCSQPLYYLLTYSANMYEWRKNNPSRRLFDRMMTSLSSFFKKDSVFYAEIRKLSKFIIQNEDGFKQFTTNTIIKLS